MNKEYAVAFAGGGTKGAYQVGVIKALKELNIKISAVSGASIGTINAAMFVQDSIKELEKLYKNIKVEDILYLKDSSNIDTKKSLLDPKNIMKLLSEMFISRGISNQPLKELLIKNINLDKLYSSKIDFSFMVYDATNKKGVELTRDNIPKEKMIDYILASTCFPIFKPQKINNKKYIDGGFSDNIPIDVLIKKGYKDIIVVDILGIGVIKKNTYKNINFKVIKPKESIGGLFEFNPETIHNNIIKGYLDTLKSFHKLVGLNYLFPKKEYYKLLDKFTIEEIMSLENAADYYRLDKLKKYSYNTFTKELLTNYEADLKKYKKISKDITNIKSIKELVKNKLVFPLIEDISNNYPTLLTTYKGIFSKYTSASDSLKILYKENNNENNRLS